MDTDAIYSAVCDYGRSCRSRNVADEADHFERIIRHLDEADEKHLAVLTANEKLVDEVAELKAAYESQFKELHELKAKLTEKASLLRGCYARINTLERTLTHIHGVALAEDHRDLPGIAKDAKEALEKKHEDR